MIDIPPPPLPSGPVFYNSPLFTFCLFFAKKMCGEREKGGQISGPGPEIGPGRHLSCANRTWGEKEEESAINSLIAQSEAGREESPPVWPKEKGGPTSQPERHRTEGTDTGPRKEEEDEERKRTDGDGAIVPLYDLGRKHSLF